MPADTREPPRRPVPSATAAVLVRFVGILLVVGSIVRRSRDPAMAHWLAVAGWSVFAVGAGLDLAVPERRTPLRWIVLAAAVAIAVGHLVARR
jgi:hypothetical protein